jgi:hypothetical protein
MEARLAQGRLKTLLHDGGSDALVSEPSVLCRSTPKVELRWNGGEHKLIRRPI